MTLVLSSAGSTISLSPWISLALLKLKCVLKHTSYFPESFRFPLGNLFLLEPDTVSKKCILPFCFQIELIESCYYICDH